MKGLKVTALEKKKYALKEKRDFEILDKLKQLEKIKLTKEDKFWLNFLKTQLEDDWRKPLLRMLNRLLKKYKKKS
ncbi:hypothetical protein KY306_01780 [Candidatus Woesearchaeota archaeon]|nr:hypothetical protein [Candidatus Woesearchaeota archaeon]